MIARVILILALIAAGLPARADCHYDCASAWSACNAKCMKDGGKGSCFSACDAEKAICYGKCRTP